MVTIDVRHDGLARLERVSAPTQALAEQRATTLNARWNEAFRARPALTGPTLDAVGKLIADERTAEAERAVHALSAILIDSVRAEPATDWSALVDLTPFAEAAPMAPLPPQADIEPRREDFPRAPLTLATLISPRALRRRREFAEAKFETAHSGWKYLTRWRDSEHEKALAVHRAALSEWQAREAAFLERQARANARLDALVEGYRAGEAEAVIGHCDLNLLSLARPDRFPCFWTMRYAAGALEIDYDLPSMEAVPILKAVKYLPSRGTFEMIVQPERERERVYGEAVFQTALAVLHTLFSGDAAGALKAIAFNGWANYVDGAALRPGRACILSVTTTKELFQGIDLASVDPQACFRALNGTMSAKLATLAMAQPAQR